MPPWYARKNNGNEKETHKMKKPILTICLLLAAAIVISAQQKDFPKLAGPYLGQKPPGRRPNSLPPEYYPPD
jgi:hypothetical protein